MDVKILRKTKSSVQLQINCTTLLNSSEVILKLTANKQSKNYLTEYLKCPMCKKLDLHDLNPTTKYTVIAEYPLGSDSIECKLKTFIAQPGKSSFILGRILLK